MPIASDWTITYGATKTVQHTSGTTVYTALEFFQWLAAEFAAQAQMDDDYCIQSDTPTVFKWINGWAFGAPTVDYKFLKGGSIESSTGNDLWSNLYSLGDQYRSSFIYVIQNDAEIAPWWGVGNIDILLNVKTGGSLIDSGNVRVMSRDSDGLYDHNDVNLAGGGRNPVGVNTFQDLNYQNTGDFYLDVDTVTGFDVGNYVAGVTSAATARIQYIDTPNTRLYCVMGEGLPFTAAGETVQERTTRGGASTGTTAVLGAAGEIEVISGYDDITLTFGDSTEDLNNGAGGKPYKVVIDCAGRTMTQVYQYLKFICRHNSATTINADTGEEYRSTNEGVYTDTKQAPFGTFAGGTFFGARGVWVENYAAAAFQLTDANGDVQLPPSYQKVAANHVNLSGCNVYVAEISGGVIVKNQYTINTTTANSITVTATINANKVPQAGVVRVGDARFVYTSFAGMVFSGVSPSPSGQTGSLYAPLLDVTADATSELSANIIYNTTFDVRTVVRKYGYKPYTQDTQFGTTGLTFSPILTPDPQAT